MKFSQARFPSGRFSPAFFVHVLSDFASKWSATPRHQALSHASARPVTNRPERQKYLRQKNRGPGEQFSSLVALFRIFLSPIFLPLSRRLPLAKVSQDDTTNGYVGPQVRFHWKMVQQLLAMVAKSHRRMPESADPKGGIGMCHANALGSQWGLAGTRHWKFDCSAQVVRQSLHIRTDLQSQAPIGEQLEQGLKEQLGAGDGWIPTGFVHHKPSAISARPSCVNEFVFDGSGPQVDEFPMAEIQQEQVVQKLRPMAGMQCLDRLQLEDHPVRHKEVQEVRLFKSPVTHMHGYLHRGGWSQPTDQLLLINALFKHPTKVAMHRKDLGHKAVGDRPQLSLRKPSVLVRTCDGHRERGMENRQTNNRPVVTCPSNRIFQFPRILSVRRHADIGIFLSSIFLPFRITFTRHPAITP